MTSSFTVKRLHNIVVKFIMFDYQIVIKNLQKKKKIASKPTNHTYQENPNSPQISLYTDFTKEIIISKIGLISQVRLPNFAFTVMTPNLAVIMHYNLLQQEFKHSDSLTNYIDRPPAMRTFKKLVKAKQTAEIFF